MKLAYKILRTIAVSLLLTAILLPAALYVALSTEVVQNFMRRRAASELTTLLGSQVSIDHIAVSPFNRVTLFGVKVANPDSLRTDSIPYALTVRQLGAGINIWDYLAHDRMVINYAEIIEPHFTLYRDSAAAPLNIAPIIEKLSPKDTSRPSPQYDLSINTVVIRSASLDYNVLSAPVDTTRFNANHISINALNADLLVPRLSNNRTEIDLRRLTLTEQSGLAISDISAGCIITPDTLSLRGLEISTPTSHLAFNDQTLSLAPDSHLRQHRLASLPVDISLNPGSHISTADLSKFVPALAPFDVDLAAQFHLHGTLSSLNVDNLSLVSDSGVEFYGEGHVDGLLTDSLLHFTIPAVSLQIEGTHAAEIVALASPEQIKLARLLRNAGSILASLSAQGTTREGNASVGLITTQGRLTLDTDYRSANSRPSFTGYLAADQINLANLLQGVATGAASSISDLSLSATYDITPQHTIPGGNIQVDLSSITYLGHQYTNISAEAEIDHDAASIALTSECPGLNIDAYASLQPYSEKARLLDFTVNASDLNLANLGIYPRYPHRKLTLQATGSVSASSLHDASGRIDIETLDWTNNSGKGLILNDMMLLCTRNDEADTLSITSEIIDGEVIGHFDIPTLIPTAKAIVAATMPALANADSTAVYTAPTYTNDFTYSFSVNTLEPLEPTVKIPVKLLHPVRIYGAMHGSTGSLSATVDAPYLLQGKKIIEGTTLQACISDQSDSLSTPAGAHINFGTAIPTKDGLMHILAGAHAVNDHLDCNMQWRIDRRHLFTGDLNLSARFRRDEEHRLTTRVNINPGTAVFNDTVWTVEPALITCVGKEISVDDFKAWRHNQAIEITGRASESPLDTLSVSLQNVNLDYVFETLAIPTAMFGGNVTGQVYATRLLTSSPQAFTPGLQVNGLKYNGTVLGDALLRSAWDNADKSVSIFADITQADTRHSTVDGKIYVLADSLDFHFDADRIPIGFLQTYMAAFATDVSGYATGKAHLWGTFKLIDMTGDVFGEDVKITLGFTNTSYTTTDTVHLTPGRIDIPPITIHDDFGHTATLKGWLTHQCFKSPEFKFEVSDARDLLVYDVRQHPDLRWYGKVFGNGHAEVSGRPGLVDINLDMTTTAGSSFTYILSDALEAPEFTFLTFRDRNQALKDSLEAASAPPLVLEYRRKLQNESDQSQSSNYLLDLKVDITPQAQINLVMDPVGGDCIRAHGSGNLRMTYDASNEDLRMNGTYVVDRGSYNFTLQDIIIKDFKLREGSSIAFHGDPYAAQLDLVASYQAKANLTDLDQSFLEDKELNRTNVPVDALLIVKGDMRQPEITFDLDFPTLTQETKRKVRSIINTEEMMNRQIIYLLALNRFYTPDYMKATRGNEFFSVASSTLSSQLSNILGQLSDNWSIAPNLRSDRGDFSDVEVDVALSSQLLNNRLLLNGNFGYRDKSLNNNSFIGDFDIEYLLNPRGTWRLKAYNRYNDQNYYLKSALTTQGVGIVFKRDFDDFFSFLRRKRPAKTQTDTTETGAPTPRATSEQPDTSLLQFH